MAKKSTIINVTVDTTINTAYVTYSTGSEKMYPANKLPKTVQAWLEAHQEPEADQEDEPVESTYAEHAWTPEVIAEKKVAVEKQNEEIENGTALIRVMIKNLPLMPKVVKAEPTEQPAQLPAVIVPVQIAEAVTDQDDRILLRWFLPTIPWMFLWWAVMYAWAGVTVIGKIVGLVEAVKPHIVEGIRFIRTWWKQSAGFRAELIQEYRLADWEVA